MTEVVDQCAPPLEEGSDHGNTHALQSSFNNKIIGETNFLDK